MKIPLVWAILAALFLSGGIAGGGMARAQEAADPAIAAKTGEARGPVTNLPLPRFVSLKTSEGNARRGPGLTHRIDWVFTRRDMPLRITAEHENWRRVEDAESAGGWVHYSLLSGVRTVIVAKDIVAFHASPDTESTVVLKAEEGVVARILACQPGWCRLSVEGQRGWAETASLWGVEPGEIID